MSSGHLKHSKITCFQAFTVILCTLALLACAERESANLVPSGGNNGPIGGKPTPEDGQAVAGHAAIAFIATKQLSRALDIVVAKGSSKTLHKCQKVTVKQNGNDEIISINSSTDACNAIGWTAEEEIIVTYDDTTRNDVKKIVRIKKNDSQKIRIDNNRRNSANTKSIRLDEEQLLFERTEGLVYNFTYKGDLDLTTARGSGRPRNTDDDDEDEDEDEDEDRDNNRNNNRNSNRNKNNRNNNDRDKISTTYSEIKLNAKGSMSIVDGSWNISMLSADVILTENKRKLINLSTVLSSPSSTDQFQLVCGIPLSIMNWQQNPDTEDEISGSIASSVNGVEVDVGLNGASGSTARYEADSCAEGLADIEQTLDKAVRTIKNNRGRTNPARSNSLKSNSDRTDI